MSHWADKTQEVIGATSRFIPNYGYLYIFDCRYGNAKFTHMSQIFLPRELNYDPVAIYKYFKNIETKTNVKTITSLNRKKGRDEGWAIEKAKTYADEKREQDREQNIKPIKQPIKQDKPADTEWVSNLLQNKMKEWDNKKKNIQKNEQNNWYRNYLDF